MEVVGTVMLLLMVVVEALLCWRYNDKGGVGSCESEFTGGGDLGDSGNDKCKLPGIGSGIGVVCDGGGGGECKRVNSGGRFGDGGVRGGDAQCWFLVLAVVGMLCSPVGQDAQ